MHHRKSTRLSCAQYFKDTIQKQFTTLCVYFVTNTMLCSILQRYNSKAIHNSFTFFVKILIVVLNTSKIQFKSNSQHQANPPHQIFRCAQYFKDTIQKQFTTNLARTITQTMLCSILQRYNSKAIHNGRAVASNNASVVLNTSKIQFKSNSQQQQIYINIKYSCAQYFKDTIQKQFTTYP